MLQCLRLHYLVLPLVLIISMVSPAQASVIVQYNVDTSSIAGTVGSLNFQLNPGGGAAQAVSAVISSFVGGTLNSNVVTFGSVSGTLPGNVSFNNSTFFNSYQEDFTFGASLQFQVTFSGPGIDAPDPLADGTAFSLFLYDAPGGLGNALLPSPSDPNDSALGLNIIGGSFSVYGSPAVTTSITQVVPEPSSLLVTGLVLGLAGAFRLNRRKKSSHPTAETICQA